MFNVYYMLTVCCLCNNRINDFNFSFFKQKVKIHCEISFFLNVENGSSFGFHAICNVRTLYFRFW